MLPVFRFGDLQHIFRLYGNCGTKMNSSYVTAVWAPCAVAYRPRCGTTTGAGAYVHSGTAPGVRMPGLVEKSGCSRQNWGKMGLRL